MKFSESKTSLIEQLLKLQDVLELDKDTSYLWYEIVNKISYDEEENYILSKAIYLLANESDKIELYGHQEIKRLIKTIENIRA